MVANAQNQHRIRRPVANIVNSRSPFVSENARAGMAVFEPGGVGADAGDTHIMGGRVTIRPGQLANRGVLEKK
jgi:hypothetical protein